MLVVIVDLELQFLMHVAVYPETAFDFNIFDGPFWLSRLCILY